LQNHSFNELKDIFLVWKRDWMPVYLPSLNTGIDPNQKIYTDFQFKKLEEFFLGLKLTNVICKRINCFDVNLNHTHSKPETKEEYQERIIRLLEEWKEVNEDNEDDVDPSEREIYESEMIKLIQIITFWKEKHSFEEKVTKLSEYFDNSRVNSFSKSSQLFELEERCKKLLLEKEKTNTKETENKSKDWINKLFSSPWTWFCLLLVILLMILIVYKHKRN
jgi:Fe2+ transport system protein B